MRWIRKRIGRLSWLRRRHRKLLRRLSALLTRLSKRNLRLKLIILEEFQSQSQKFCQRLRQRRRPRTKMTILKSNSRLSATKIRCIDLRSLMEMTTRLRAHSTTLIGMNGEKGISMSTWLRRRPKLSQLSTLKRTYTSQSHRDQKCASTMRHITRNRNRLKR